MLTAIRKTNFPWILVQETQFWGIAGGKSAKGQVQPDTARTTKTLLCQIQNYHVFN